MFMGKDVILDIPYITEGLFEVLRSILNVSSLFFVCLIKIMVCQNFQNDHRICAKQVLRSIEFPHIVTRLNLFRGRAKILMYRSTSNSKI